MRHFVTRSGDRLMEGDREYRFVSFNVPNLHLVEDDMRLGAASEWRFPDEFEITDALETVKQLGGRAARMYVISICGASGNSAIPCHVSRPGVFNEEAFRALDKVLDVANRVGVRVIIPLVDQWKWWGGVGEYAEWRSKPAAAFWTDREVIDDFKQTIQFVINRRNTLTGKLYRDDKAILAWETGNELDSPYSWTKEIAATIKALDPNHLVLDGYYVGSHEIRPEALTDPNTDIISSHHYPGANRNPGAMAADVEKISRQIAGKKVYIVGEFGFIPLPEVQRVLDSVIRNNVAGALIWSLRFHNRDGGFYWHTEGASADAFKAYHYPGFPSGSAYAEHDLLALMRAKAFEIRGLAPASVEPPVPPVLLPMAASFFSWKGSAGASSYDVERSESQDGPWTLVGADVDDAALQYRPNFEDVYAEQGRQYFYRVRAKNEAGSSEPSNVIGPVLVDSLFILDEMRDLSRVFAHGGALTLEFANPRKAWEDASRVKGAKGSWLVYRTLNPLRSASVQALFEGNAGELDFQVSRDGINFTSVQASARDLFKGKGDYGYWKLVTFQIRAMPPGNYFLKLIFKSEAQISNVEIEHKR
jgi:mannan endo-1,4-beta-mannosidase